MRPVPRRTRPDGSGMTAGGGGGSKSLGVENVTVPPSELSAPVPDWVRAKLKSPEVSVFPAAVKEPAGRKKPLMVKVAPEECGPVAP